jgi:hypothetical protein
MTLIKYKKTKKNLGQGQKRECNCQWCHGLKHRKSTFMDAFYLNGSSISNSTNQNSEFFKTVGTPTIVAFIEFHKIEYFTIQFFAEQFGICRVFANQIFYLSSNSPPSSSFEQTSTSLLRFID